MAVGRVQMMQVYAKINALGAQLRQRNLERNWKVEDQMEESVKTQTSSINWMKNTDAALIVTTLSSALAGAPAFNALSSNYPTFTSVLKTVHPTIQMMSGYNKTAYEETKAAEGNHQTVFARQIEMNSTARNAFGDMVAKLHEAAVSILSASHQAFIKTS